MEQLVRTLKVLVLGPPHVYQRDVLEVILQNYVHSPSQERFRMFVKVEFLRHQLQLWLEI